jgi:glyoxylase-like metal-dependent hydrolase (beta-lactamase superfamily II)
VLDFDPVAVRATTSSAERIAAHVENAGLTVDWILESHVHADHLSASQHLRSRVGGRIAISAHVDQVQNIFAGVFNAEAAFVCDGSQFDQLLRDGDTLPLGDATINIMETPGHTPACVTFLVNGCAFVGDTLFMPDYGSARTDFPGGDAHQLYRSIRRILSLPGSTKLYMCHDYGTDTRSTFAYETTVEEQNRCNVHINHDVNESEFVSLREARDAGLAAPRLLYPAVQFNMRAGRFPPPEHNGKVYLKLPLKDD